MKLKDVIVCFADLKVCIRLRKRGQRMQMLFTAIKALVDREVRYLIPEVNVIKRLKSETGW